MVPNAWGVIWCFESIKATYKASLGESRHCGVMWLAMGEIIKHPGFVKGKICPKAVVPVEACFSQRLEDFSGRVQVPAGRLRRLGVPSTKKKNDLWFFQNISKQRKCLNPNSSFWTSKVLNLFTFQKCWTMSGCCCLKQQKSTVGVVGIKKSLNVPNLEPLYEIFPRPTLHKHKRFLSSSFPRLHPVFIHFINSAFCF